MFINIMLNHTHLFIYLSKFSIKFTIYNYTPVTLLFIVILAVKSEPKHVNLLWPHHSRKPPSESWLSVLPRTVAKMTVSLTYLNRHPHTSSHPLAGTVSETFNFSCIQFNGLHFSLAQSLHQKKVLNALSVYTGTMSMLAKKWIPLLLRKTIISIPSDSRHRSWCLSQGQITSYKITGQHAYPTEFLSICKSDFCLRVCVLCLQQRQM